MFGILNKFDKLTTDTLKKLFGGGGFESPGAGKFNSAGKALQGVLSGIANKDIQRTEEDSTFSVEDLVKAEKGTPLSGYSRSRAPADTQYYEMPAKEVAEEPVEEADPEDIEAAIIRMYGPRWREGKTKGQIKRILNNI